MCVCGVCYDCSRSNQSHQPGRVVTSNFPFVRARSSSHGPTDSSSRTTALCINDFSWVPCFWGGNRQKPKSQLLKNKLLKMKKKTPHLRNLLLGAIAPSSHQAKPLVFSSPPDSNVSPSVWSLLFVLSREDGVCGRGSSRSGVRLVRTSSPLTRRGPRGRSSWRTSRLEHQLPTPSSSSATSSTGERVQISCYGL